MIILHEDDPKVVDRMLRWCYTQEYDDRKYCDSILVPEGLPLIMNARMYALADKYGLSGLKSYVITKFTAALPSRLRPEPQDALIKAVEILLSTTPTSDRGLRTAFLKWFQHSGVLLMYDCRFQDLLRSGLADGEFCMDIMQCCKDALCGIRHRCDGCRADVVNRLGRKHGGVETVCEDCGERIGWFMRV